MGCSGLPPGVVVAPKPALQQRLFAFKRTKETGMQHVAMVFMRIQRAHKKPDGCVTHAVR